MLHTSPQDGELVAERDVLEREPLAVFDEKSNEKSKVA